MRTASTVICINLLGESLRWVRSARRENARRAQAAPLFWHAGLVSPTTARERERRFTEGRTRELEQWRAFEAGMTAKAVEARAILELLLTPAEVLAMDEQRLRYPPGCEYTAEFWCGSLRRWFQMQPGVTPP